MCSPTLALTAITTVVSAYGQMQQANAEAKSIQITAQNNQKIAEYNAKVADVNAEMNNRAGKDALQRGASDAATIRENTLKANARGRALMGSQGLLTSSGTPLDLLVQNRGEGEQNALTVFNNAEREAYGFKVAETNDRAQATNLRYQGKLGMQTAAYQAGVVKQSGLYNAAGTLVTGAADFGKLGGFGRSTYYPKTNTTVYWNSARR